MLETGVVPGEGRGAIASRRKVKGDILGDFGIFTTLKTVFEACVA